MITKESRGKYSVRWFPFLLLLSIVVLVWAALGGIVWLGPFWEGMDERGQFGDLFGAVNALFSGLAFAGVIYAIILQRNELSLQRRELELSRRELRKAAEAQERSHAALAEQARLQAHAATLSAYDSLVELYENRIRRERFFDEKDALAEKQDRYADLLEIAIEEIQRNNET